MSPRLAVWRVAAVALLAVPGTLAFFSGGYFSGPMTWAGLVIWALVTVALIVVPGPVLGSNPARLAVGGLAAFAGWTLVSTTWAPLAGTAYQAGQEAVLYLGTLVAASLLLRDGVAARALEPALAGSAAVVVGYGLAERFLPGALHLARSVSAEGRLEQPLTYWNAMGEVAGLGHVLCCRLAGDASRQRSLRLLAMGASAALGLGLYLSFSRGALFAWVAGLVALLAVARTHEQLRAIVLCAAAAVLGAVAAAPFRAVTAFAGSLHSRERTGLVVLGLVVAISVATALIGSRFVVQQAPRALALPRSATKIAIGLICAGLAVAIIVGAKEQPRALSGGASRLTALSSNRYEYWRVAFKAFAAQPVWGVGAGGWSVYWLRYRPFREFAHDAHSLPLQTLAELGLVGFSLLLAFLAGLLLAAQRALKRVPGLAAGPIAAGVAYLAHAPLDWDWEMPAVTIFGMILAGALVAYCREVTALPRSAAPRD